MARPTLSELAHLLSTQAEGDTPIAGIALDSRDVLPGQLFVALKGMKVDGHDYVKEALAKGAAAALVSEEFSLEDATLIKVKDPLIALQDIARWHVGRTKATVVAITGSVGKTTTKEFLYTLLKSKYKTACTSGNQNSQVGMAASLINNVHGDEEYAVVEMGMTEAGHIKRLVDIVPPDKALVTQIALVHAENFDSIEDIARAKAEIFSHPKTKISIICKDSPCSECMRSSSPGYFYSMQDRGADFFLEVTPGGLIFNGSILPFVTLAAPHVYLNLLGAMSMALCCGMSTDEIGQALHTLKMPEKRLEKVQKAGICFVNDSYNAAEPSLKAALSYIKGQNASRKIAVIGQMRELGRFSEGCHKAVGEHALDCVDTIYCLGIECAPILQVCNDAHKPCRLFTEFSDLIAVLQNDLRKDDLVLLKGSRSNGLWRVLDYFN